MTDSLRRMVIGLLSRAPDLKDTPLSEASEEEKAADKALQSSSPELEGITHVSSASQEIKPGIVSNEIISVPCKTLDVERIMSRYREISSINRAKDLMDRFEDYIMRQGLSRMPFYKFRISPESRIILIKDTRDLEGRNVWFVGDLHCDVLGLEACLGLIRKTDEIEGKRSYIVFLGDIFDDDSYNYEIMLRIIELLISAGAEGQPDICLLTGNHDESLVYNGHSFSALVEPSQFSAQLNEKTDDQDLKIRLGFLTSMLFRHTARAIFFPNGLLAAHGGFPLSDRWRNLNKLEDFDDSICLQDFVWTRAHMTAPRKRPNRFVKDSQFGYTDFAEFCSKATKALGHPVKRMIRGHDHVEGRYVICQDSILTINTLSRRLSREVLGEFERTPCIAKYQEKEDELPKVYRMEFSPDDIQAVFAVRDKAAEVPRRDVTS